MVEGDYIALLVRPDGSGGSQQGHVTATGDQTITIPAPLVTLSGVVTLDGKPHGGVIHIRDTAFMRPEVVVSADANGHYRAMLDRPASYTIRVYTDGGKDNRNLGFSLTAVSGPQAGRMLPLHEGANQLDIPVITPK